MKRVWICSNPDCDYNSKENEPEHNESSNNQSYDDYTPCIGTLQPYISQQDLEAMLEEESEYQHENGEVSYADSRKFSEIISKIRGE